MPELETVDIPGVEIMATGGPVFAIGSAAGGDFYTRTDLEAIADAHQELGNEIRAPLKLGHSDRQQLLKNSGLTVGELPAVGWLDSKSFQVVDDEETGQSKLVADLKAVPKKLAALMEKGAYRTRSSEIKRYASQVTEKSYDWVVYGLALLGNNTPAIQTLDDVYKLYESAGIDEPSKSMTFIVRHLEAPTWPSGQSYEAIRNDIAETLNGAAPYGAEVRYWVRDVADSLALVCEGYDNDEAWLVPWSRNSDGVIELPNKDTWTRAEQAWIATTREYESKNLRAAEPRTMEANTITTEELAPLAEALGVEGEVTVEALKTAAETRANELADAKSKAEEAETRRNEADKSDERIKKLEADLKVEQTRRFESERDADIKEALRTRIEPADKEKWEKRYETLGVEQARELLFELPKRETTREFGSDDDGREDDGDDDMKAFEAEIAREAGVPVEELI